MAARCVVSTRSPNSSKRSISTNAPGHVINGLKREELVALNSTLLHELYFASLGGEGKPTKTMADVIARQFGSFDRWRTEFRTMGYALGGGSGWVVLTYIPRNGHLLNQYAAEHSQAAVSGVPILALDMYEHAYHMDFGANAKAYVDAFLRNVDWQGVEGRYGDATKVAPPRPLIQEEFADVPSIGVEEVKAMLAANEPVQVIDVRPRHSLSRQQDIADGIAWRDPDRLQDWIRDLSQSQPVVVYCAYGFHVGCGTARKLREAGFDAKYMNSGHSRVEGQRRRHSIEPMIGGGTRSTHESRTRQGDRPCTTLARSSTAPAYSLWQLVRYMLRLGSLGFGGPVALCGYMHRDLVDAAQMDLRCRLQGGTRTRAADAGAARGPARDVPRIRPLPNDRAQRWSGLPLSCPRF